MDGMRVFSRFSLRPECAWNRASPLRQTRIRLFQGFVFDKNSVPAPGYSLFKSGEQGRV